MRYVLLASCFFLVTATPVFAANWAVDSSKSHLGFIGTQGSTHFNGSFGSFKTTIDLDPDHPETGKITATIDIGSITAGSNERDSYLPQPDWFNTKVFPQATFTSSSIQKTGDHAYLAMGNLTIKNITQPMSLPFTLVQEGDHWHAQGKVTLARTDFHIGDGDWSNEEYVKRAVDVVIDLIAKPQP
jgi:polyisoprenoid-binding protein YceI